MTESRPASSRSILLPGDSFFCAEQLPRVIPPSKVIATRMYMIRPLIIGVSVGFSPKDSNFIFMERAVFTDKASFGAVLVLVLTCLAGESFGVGDRKSTRLNSSH